MVKWITAFFLLLLAGALVWGGSQLMAEDPPPPYEQSLRESRPLLPLLQKRRGARVEATVSLQSTQAGASPLSRALARGMFLGISGEIAPRFSDLQFRLRSGSGEASWQEVRSEGRRALVVQSSPYIYPGSFLGNDWEAALRPRPLLGIWKALPSVSRDAENEQGTWAYQISSKSRAAGLVRSRVALLRALDQGKLRVLFDRSSGAPAGILWTSQTSAKKTAAMLGISPALLLGSGDISWRVFYRVTDWNVGRSPALPERLYPRGRAALEAALLPFYVGLQE